MKAIKRIYQYIDFKDIKAVPFEKKIGLSNGYLSKQLKRNADLGESILLKIIENCPDLNPNWLLTGNGEMLLTNNIERLNINPITINRRTTDPAKNIQDIPLYNLEATAGLKELLKGSAEEFILDRIHIPNIASCDGAIYVTGDSMYPLLKSGDIILFKEIDINRIFWGEMYLLSAKVTDWEEYITVKFVQKSELGDEYVKLVSQNQHHQPKDIPIKDITAIALIRASIRLHSS